MIKFISNSKGKFFAASNKKDRGNNADNCKRVITRCVPAILETIRETLPEFELSPGVSDRRDAGN